MKRFSTNFYIALLGLLLACPVGLGANNPIDELNQLRSQMACLTDKKSSEYIKIKNKFDKIIAQNQIDYSNEKRFQDAINLINEQKYNPAIYELKALIDEGYNVSKCNELLGDICIKAQKNHSKAVKYYKRALKANSKNISTAYKLAKIYLKFNRNTLGIEYLKYTVENTKSPEVLAEIEYIIKNKLQPEDKYDANNMYEVLGEIYVRQNKKQEAFDAFRTALKLNPNDLYLKYYLGDLYYSVGDMQNAEVVYDAILYDNPDDSGIRTSKAKSMLKEGNLMGADREYREMLIKNPDSVQALYGLYKIYEKKLPVDKILEKIYSSNPNYKVTKSEALKFAKILEGTNDKNAINAFIAYANEIDKVERQKEEALKKEKEAEKYRLEQIEREKQQKINLQNKKLQEQKEAIARKNAEAERLRLQKLEEQKRLAKIAEEERIKNEAIIKEQQRKALIEKQRKEAEALALRKQQEQKRLEEQRLLAERKAQEARLLEERKAQEAKLLAEKKAREEQLLREQKEKEAKLLAEKKAREEQIRLQKEAELQKQRELEAKLLAEKKAQEAKLLEERKAQEAKLLAEKKAREEQIRLQKEAELQKKKEEERIKAEQLALEKEKQRIKEQKEREAQLVLDKKQKEYEDRVIADETKKAKNKDLAAYNKTMEQVKKYSAINPKTASNYIAIANTYKMNNQPMSAIRNYKEASKLDPANSDIYYDLGLTYMELNSFVTSRANLVKAVHLDKDNQKAKNLLAFVNQKVITGVINNAYSKFDKKQYIEAYDILNAGIKDFGDNSQLYYYRALVADAMNRNSAQILDLKKSIELDPSNYMSFYQLGKAYEKLNDERNALVSYERFLSTEPDEKDLVDEVQKKVIKLGEKYY